MYNIKVELQVMPEHAPAVINDARDRGLTVHHNDGIVMTTIIVADNAYVSTMSEFVQWFEMNRDSMDKYTLGGAR